MVGIEVGADEIWIGLYVPALSHPLVEVILFGRGDATRRRKVQVGEERLERTRYFGVRLGHVHAEWVGHMT